MKKKGPKSGEFSTFKGVYILSPIFINCPPFVTLLSPISEKEVGNSGSKVSTRPPTDACTSCRLPPPAMARARALGLICPTHESHRDRVLFVRLERRMYLSSIISIQ